MSPLIATILLVAFVVILAAIIFVFARDYTENLISKDRSLSRISCATDIGFSVDSAMLGANSISLTMTNLGGTIGGWVFRVIGSNGVDVAIINEGLDEGASKEMSFVYDSSFTGDVSSVEIYPRVQVVKGAYETCQEKLKEWKFE
ncbi:MAG TPA: archaellin/type IV pilin N-terminal domain-containing protein [Candidatus Nanoarchaeia archaeon]|nr:archaellin/type IV pilin N-terminal domain-containing protein [Candidatus Nanoarchaeia archaeon]